MKGPVVAIIMAGGRGERFWPRSRRDRPKQVLNLLGEGVMINVTYNRLTPLVDKRNIFVVTGKDLGGLIKKYIHELPSANIIREPARKNTAPCIGLASIIAQHRTGADPVCIVLPADHYIPEEERFRETLRTAIEAAQEGEWLVTTGIKPKWAETDYGYIKKGEVYKDGAIPVYKVAEFKEKPSQDVAEEYLRDGSYLWNSGIFVWRASSILNAMRQYMPSLFEGLERIKDALGGEEENEVIQRVYDTLERTSIDYGVLEKAEKVLVVEGDFAWDDIGSWLAMERLYEKDEKGNVCIGDCAGLDTRDCILVGEGGLVATIGLEGFIVVRCADVTLVCRKEDVERIRELLLILSQDSSLEKYL